MVMNRVHGDLIRSALLLLCCCSFRMLQGNVIRMERAVPSLEKIIFLLFLLLRSDSSTIALKMKVLMLSFLLLLLLLSLPIPLLKTCIYVSLCARGSCVAERSCFSSHSSRYI